MALFLMNVVNAVYLHFSRASAPRRMSSSALCAWGAERPPLVPRRTLARGKNIHRRGAKYAEKNRKANYWSLRPLRLFFSCERSTPHEQFRALRVTGRGAPHARAA